MLCTTPGPHVVTVLVFNPHAAQHPAAHGARTARKGVGSRTTNLPIQQRLEMQRLTPVHGTTRLTMLQLSQHIRLVSKTQQNCLSFYIPLVQFAW